MDSSYEEIKHQNFQYKDPYITDSSNKYFIGYLFIKEIDSLKKIILTENSNFHLYRLDDSLYYFRTFLMAKDEQ